MHIKAFWSKGIHTQVLKVLKKSTFYKWKLIFETGNGLLNQSCQIYPWQNHLPWNTINSFHDSFINLFSLLKIWRSVLNLDFILEISYICNICVGPWSMNDSYLIGTLGRRIIVPGVTLKSGQCFKYHFIRHWRKWMHSKRGIFLMTFCFFYSELSFVNGVFTKRNAFL